MLDRYDPSRVLCGHCNQEMSAGACSGCGRQVCEGCLADFTSCPEARSFEYRLGLGARLRHVARGGALGLVSTMTRRLGLLDVLGRRRAADAGWDWRWTRAMADAGGMSSRGELLWPRTFTRNLFSGDLRISSVGLVDYTIQLSPPVSKVRFDRSESALIGSTVDERVLITPLDGSRPEIVTPMARRVIQAFDADLDSGVIAAATHGELGVIRRGDHRRIGVSTEGRGDCRWLGVVGERIAIVFDRPPWEHQVLIMELEDRELTPIYSATHRGKSDVAVPAVADISDDGRFIAVGLVANEVAVHDYQAGGVQRLEGHTDRISAIRFGPRARFIVTGDFDNRVIVRFRDGDRFVERLESLDLIQLD